MSPSPIQRQACARIPTPAGEFQLCAYTLPGNEKQPLAIVWGEVAGQSDVLVRIHSECFTGDVLGSLRCDCGEQFHRALALITQAERGVLIYLRQEGRGIGLLDKLRAYNLQDRGYDTVDANLILGHQADEREYSTAADILLDLGVRSIRLLTNNPHKIMSLRALGVTVAGRIPLEGAVTRENASYLEAKRSRLHHWLSLDAPRSAAEGSDGRQPPDGSD